MPLRHEEKSKHRWFVAGALGIAGLGLFVGGGLLIAYMVVAAAFFVYGAVPLAWSSLYERSERKKSDKSRARTWKLAGQ